MRKLNRLVTSMRTVARHTAFSTLVGWFLTTAVAAAAGPMVKTTAGMIEGVESEGVISFKGVPLGKPPVGNLRWTYALPAESWEGIRKADQYASPCLQPQSPLLMGMGKDSCEDCLYLNIWSTDLNKDAKKPVIVWI